MGVMRAADLVWSVFSSTVSSRLIRSNTRIEGLKDQVPEILNGKCFKCNKALGRSKKTRSTGTQFAIEFTNGLAQTTD
jgi:hypothetical protein